jgi:hypothetical protein
MGGCWGGGVLDGVSDMKRWRSVGWKNESNRRVTDANVPVAHGDGPGTRPSLVVRSCQAFEGLSGFDPVLMRVIAIMSA